MRVLPMKRLALLALVIPAFLICAAMGGCAVNSGAPSGVIEIPHETVDAAVGSVAPALVRIHVVYANSYDGRRVKRESAGSGAIISADGYVVTNHHVAGDTVRAWVTMADKRELPAELIGTDAMSDIAVLKIVPDNPGDTFPVAHWGDSTSIEVGDAVLAMGSPLALSQSVTQGIVSNTELIMPTVWGDQRFELDGENVGAIVRWIGHDAAIFPGNSGGPLVNLDGEIIGINEISMGLSGAIPANLAREIADQLIADGEVSRAYVGLLLQPLTKQVQHEDGAIISTVLRDSPAAKGGLQSGDRLLAINDEPVLARFAEQLPLVNLAMASLPIDKPATITVRRGGNEMKMQITPIRREKAKTDDIEFREWGLTGRNLTLWNLHDMSRESRDGVLVTSTSAGGPAGAAKPEIQNGDIIAQAGSHTIKNLEDLREATEAITKDQKEPVDTVVTFERGNENYVTVVKVGIRGLPDPGRDVRKAWVPVKTQVLTRELAKTLEMPDQVGVRVVQVYSPQEGEQAPPFQVGDLILKIDGEVVQASEPHHSEVFDTMVRQYKIGSEAEFTILRGGETQNVTMTLPGRPDSMKEMQRYKDVLFEFTVREVNYLDRQKKNWPKNNDPAVVVDDVVIGGWAALGRLQLGDYILEINGQKIESVDALKEIMKGITERRDQYVEIKVHRGTQAVFLEIEPLWKEEAATGVASDWAREYIPHITTVPTFFD